MSNRRCVFKGCRVEGGSYYMDHHERQPHVSCSCGRVFGLRGLSVHIGMRWPEEHERGELLRRSDFAATTTSKDEA